MSDSGFCLLLMNKLYKKEKTKRLKDFPAGYVGSFYRNLADNIDNFVWSDFYSRIAADSDIPKEDVQKYILATSHFAKSIQTDINPYITRDRINDASFRQKLDPISMNILRKQNPLELVFEDISTFDAENPIVGSLLREIDLNKKQTDNDFIESLPSQPGKEFEIQKRLDRLRGIKRFRNDNNYNNNNNNDDGDGGGGGNLLGLGPTTPQNRNTTFIPEVPDINKILNPLPEECNAQQRLNLQVPEVDDLLQQRLNNLRGISDPTPQARPDEVPFFANSASNFHIPTQTSSSNPFRRTNPTVGLERLKKKQTLR